MDNAGVTVRAARIEDAEAIAEVHVQARNAYYRGFVDQADLDRRAAELRRIYPGLCDRADSTLLCAQLGEEIVGIVLLGPPNDTVVDPVGVGELYQLHVRPDCWRRGIGSQLHRAAVDAWHGLGVSVGVLEVWDRNERARAFYANHGWRPDGHSRPGRSGTRYLRLRLAL
ncbi:GNAT family N-acetyltransferase [Kutzneria albida]|uniref:N-acetyltransferase domain-containing protein n=1 Tax=Kutzneria albida DSM 43870 TaxID=1449976 RepID=W5WN15_9PSEU|nr:GNAT family N-acetyltransferase [Kutzneria albida]AHI02136.1 hypothetical protein KALB_8779 [Kutzneria albida DSM 43870]